MSSIFSYNDAEQKIREISFKNLVKHQANEKRIGLNQLGRMMGKDNNFITVQLSRKNIDLPLLYALSLHLSTNLFEPFQNLLPENIRPTQQEKARQQEIEDLQKQINDLTKERDLLKEIVMRN